MSEPEQRAIIVGRLAEQESFKRNADQAEADEVRERVVERLRAQVDEAGWPHEQVELTLMLVTDDAKAFERGEVTLLAEATRRATLPVAAAEAEPSGAAVIVMAVHGLAQQRAMRRRR